jgi:hypothetical protein
MAQLFKSFIPSEFLDAWMRGQYAIGPRILDYQYAGFALILRGLYRYDVQPKNVSGGELKGAFGGYAAAYLRNNELNFAGFRVYENGHSEDVPLFWKSVFSRFHSDEDNKIKLYFPYHTYRGRKASIDSDKLRSITELSKFCKGRVHLNELETEIMSGSKRYSIPVYFILEELSANASERLGDPELRGLCMLDFGPAFDVNLRPKDDRASSCDLLLTGENYGVDVSNFGTVEFRRLARSFLEKVDPDTREG